MSSKENVGTYFQKKYVVIRSGVRVSESEYTTVEAAKAEADHWQRILKKWPDGTKITIEEYNDKKHRIF